MPLFEYKAKDRQGKTRSGTVEAADEHTVAAMIREKGAYPLDIRPAVTHSAEATTTQGEAGSYIVRKLIYPIWTGVNLRALVFFYRQLAVVLNAGMSLSEALAGVGERTKGRLGRIILEFKTAVQNGQKLSEQMARHPRIFSSLQISLIDAGERGGLMEVMMDKIATYLEYELSIRHKLSRIMFYPLLLVFFIITLPYLYILISRGFKAYAVLVGSKIAPIALFFLAAVVVAKLLIQFRPMRLIWDFIKTCPPVLGTLAAKLAMTRFSKAFASLYSAGLPVASAVVISADTCGNLFFSSRLKTAARDLSSGMMLSEALKKTGVLLPLVLDMISTGEKIGNPGPVMEKVAEYLDDEIESTLYKLGIALFVVMMLIVGGMVLMVLLNKYLALFNQSLGGAN